MLSVLIDATGTGREEALARTLASLVPGTVEGVVREAIIYASEASEGVRHIAEHAGCQLVDGREAAARRARSDRVLLLRAGTRLASGWSEIVMDRLEYALALRLCRAPTTLFGWIGLRLGLVDAAADAWIVPRTGLVAPSRRFPPKAAVRLPGLLLPDWR